MITCGNCKTQHPTVADVRNCYATPTQPKPQPARDAQAQAFLAQPASASRIPATERQISFVKSLAEERDTPVAGKTLQEATLIARFEDVLGGKDVSKAEASDVITWLLALPKQTQAKPQAQKASNDADVESGRYAVVHEGVLKFYRVSKVTEGRWAGHTFVKVQASDNEYPVSRATRSQVLALIAANPKEAMLRYGKEIGSCGHCGRTLTNEESRMRGIGPVCAAGLGW